MEDIIASLDIGTTKVCVIIGRSSLSGLEVIGIGRADSHGLNKGVIVNIDSTVKAIHKAVEEAEIMAGIEVTALYVGIAGGQIEGINSRGVIAVSGRSGETEISRDDIARVINTAESVSISQDREIIHVIPQEFIVDDQDGIEDPLGMSGVRLEAEVHLVTCLKSATANIRRAVQRAGYEVADIILQPIASAEAVLNDDEKELGSVVIDIGGGTTDVLIYVNNSIWFTHVIPLGGNNVTKDISYGLRTPNASAETIKKQYGAAFQDSIEQDDYTNIPLVGRDRPSVKVSRKMIAKIIEPRMEEVFSMVKVAIEETGIVDKVAAGVVLTGGACQCDGTVELAEKVLNQPVRIGRPLNISGLSEKLNNPIYSTAVGLALFECDGEEDYKPHNDSRVGRGTGVFSKVLNFIKEFFS